MNQVSFKILTLLLVSFFVGVNHMDAQVVKLKKDLDKKSQKWYKEAISESRKGKYVKSLKLYDKILKKHPRFIDAQVRKASVLYHTKKLNASSLAFEKAVSMAPEHDPLIYFSLAIVYKDMKNYELAARNFDFYIDRAPNGDKYDRAVKLSTQSKFSHYAINNPVPFEPIKISGGVNSALSEYSPMLTMEGDKMIFTRRVAGQEDFYIADIEDDTFVNVQGVEGLNTHQNEGVHTISADGKTMIFTACDRRKTGFGSCDLFYSRLVSGEWSVPSNMGPTINTIHWDAQPSLSSDGKTLFFSSNRKYGHGGNDIWMTTRTDTSGWTTPVTLPKEVNSGGSDESPFLHPDGHTLYFRSNGHVGMGGFDIFYSRLIDSTGNWTKAKNIGYPINTEGSEGALTVSLDGTKAYFASDMEYLNNREEANLDIYSFDLYDEARPLPTTFVKAKIKDKETGESISAGYSITSLDRKSKDIKGLADEEGALITGLPTNSNYAFHVEQEGYLLYSENFTLEGITTAVDPYILNIDLIKAPTKKPATNIEEPISEPIVLNNIFFESGSAQLLEASDLELNRLAANLAQNAYANIEIHGHTDDVGSEDDNQNLSTERAKAVADSLISKGISTSRISYKGFGESRPIADNSSEEGKQRNRRTEFVLKY